MSTKTSAPVGAEDIEVLKRLRSALPDVGMNGWWLGVEVLDRVIANLTQQAAAACTCPHQDAREPDHDVACPVRRAQQPAETSITRREQELIAAAATHCDNCGCSWLDNGLNPVGCPYCKQRELLTLAEQWERDAAGCRRDGYIDAAVVKEDCAYRIRQTLGISAIAEALTGERNG